MRSCLIALVVGLGCVPAVLAAESGADPLAPYRGNLVALGTEGNWTLNLYPKHDMYLQLNAGEKHIRSPAAAPRAMGQGRVQFASKSLTVDVQKTDACKTGSDGFVYPLTVAVTTGKTTYKGCGFLRWDNDLASLIPAIDACLAKAPAKAPVTLAVRESDGVMVRLNDYENGTTICQVDETGAKPVVVKALTDKTAKKALGEDAIIFHRLPAPNPGGECYEAEKAHDKAGKFVGWLDTNEGC